MPGSGLSVIALAACGRGRCDGRALAAEHRERPVRRQARMLRCTLASAAVRKPLPEDGAAAAVPNTSASARQQPPPLSRRRRQGGRAEARRSARKSRPGPLPPMLVLRAARCAERRDARAAQRVLRARASPSRPRRRRRPRAARVESGALALLLRKPKTGAPLLVFSASGRNLRVQETTLWMTRRTVRTSRACPAQPHRRSCCSSRGRARPTWPGRRPCAPAT